MVDEKIIRVDIPEGESGKFRIEKFTVSEKDADFFNMRCAIQGTPTRAIDSGTYTRLKRDGAFDPVMSDTPAEWDDMENFVSCAEGHVIINGLGLGWVATNVASKKEVKSVLVVELERDVIKLVEPYVKHPKLTIVQGDAHTYDTSKYRKKLGIQQFDCAFHDIWDNFCEDHVPSLQKLRRRYGRLAKWQDDWLSKGLRSLW